MRNSLNYIILLLFTYILISCSENNVGNLSSVEERVSVAVSNLESELTAPSDGWKLEYQPTNESGVFFMLLQFEKDNLVTIKSDLADNDGEFFDHEIPWRVDNALGLELILETYGLFHYLFEQDGATFGAEFEFVYQGKDGDNLIVSVPVGTLIKTSLPGI